jgi:serine/threonine protein kinase
MITPAAQVKILDFGLAKRLPLSDETLPTVSRESQGGGVAGTPGYIAPEVLLGQEADYRSDIFSLGVVFYEMLVNRHPFRAKGFKDKSEGVLHLAPTVAEPFPGYSRLGYAIRRSEKTLSRDIRSTTTSLGRGTRGNSHYDA